MARWLNHEGCSNCGSRDNVGVYDDGSKFCFGCHWYKLPDSSVKLNELKDRINKHEPISTIGDIYAELPTDYTTEIPKGPLIWLLQYITQAEIDENFIGYSKAMERIIFPIYDKEFNLIMYTGRGAEGVLPKYYTVGQRTEVTHILSSNSLSNRIVLVEDLLSAIKVSRICSAMPIFGSKIPLEYARKLSKVYERLVIWLDPDKRQESLKQAFKLESHFRSGVKVIFSKEDPKCYEDTDIAKHLGLA